MWTGMPNLPDCCDVWRKKKQKSIGGDKVASWTRFHGCLHASLCSLFSSYCPRLTGWCNSQQDHSSTPLLVLLSSYSSSFPPPFPPSLPPQHFLSCVLTSFTPPFYPSSSYVSFITFKSITHSVFFIIHTSSHFFLLSYFPANISSLRPFPRISSSLFTPSFFCLSSFNSTPLSLCFSPYFFSVMECVMSLQLIPSLKHLSNAR